MYYLSHTLIIDAYISILEFYIVKLDVETVIAYLCGEC